MPGTNHRYHFLRLPCGPSSDAFGVNHASATIAIVYDVVLCNLLDLLHPRAPLDEWMSDPRYLVWLDDTAFFPYGPDRVDPGSFPPLEPHDVLAIEVAHALLQVRSDRFIRRLLRQGWSVATCRPETGRQFLDAVFHSLLVPDADAMNLFDAF